MLNPFKLIIVPERIKLIPVYILWKLDDWLDHLPVYDGKWFRYGLGCQLGLGDKALKLEKHWNIELDSLD